MKKLLIMAAFIAGPILYAQQKPAANVESSKVEFVKAKQDKASRGTPKKVSKSSDAEALNVKFSSKNAETKTTTNRKIIQAKSFNETIEN